MKDRLKKALKRCTCGLLAVLLAACLVGTPRAKAVVSEGALLGSIFGSLLVSMGYSWAAENFDAPTFGKAMYDLIQEFDETNTDTGIQLIRDLNLAALTVSKPGTIQFNYAWTQAARSFAEWFYNKFSFADNSTALIYYDGFSFAASDDCFSCNYPYSVTFNGGSKATTDLRVFLSIPGIYTCTFYTGARRTGSYFILSDVSLYVRGSRVSPTTYDVGESWTTATFNVTETQIADGAYLNVNLGRSSGFSLVSGCSYPIANEYGYISLGEASSLSAEKPQEVHYPDVAEDGSQVYDVTYVGVTATDIEGIIQGAVDRILAGTASIVGSVQQAGTVVNPEIDPYKVGLSSVFPFCIPFDVYNMVTMFVAEPEAPHAEWTFSLPWSNQEYSVGWDLSDFDGVAQVCRSMELVLFAVGLAAITHKFIKW